MTEIPLQSLSALVPGPLFRSFGHVLAAAPGLVAAVPLVRVSGQLTSLVDGCPVPWDEVATVLDAEPDSVPVELDSPDFGDLVPRLAVIASGGWRLGTLPELQATLFMHAETGARIAIAEPLTWLAVTSRC